MNDRSKGAKSQAARRGFSLLEVILALAILTGAIAVLGEAARMGMRNARVARDLTQAQVLCESKMGEISSGFTPATPVSGAAFDSLDVSGQAAGASAAGLSQWIYSIETENLDQDGLMAVTVTVSQDPAQVQRPLTFKLVRWMLDAATGESMDLTESSSAEE